MTSMALIARQVDLAVEEVLEEQSWKDLVKSLAYKEKAKELATNVAERVYRSENVIKALDTLSQSVGAAIGKRIEFATLDAGRTNHALCAGLSRSQVWHNGCRYCQQRYRERISA